MLAVLLMIGAGLVLCWPGVRVGMLATAGWMAAFLVVFFPLAMAAYRRRMAS